MWWENSEWAKKLAGGKVTGNLFYCYWFIGWDLSDLAKIVLLECNPWRNPSVLFTASSPLPNTEPAIQQMPNKCLCEWTIQRPFEWLICPTPGAELYNSTFLSPSPEEEGRWVSKYPRKSWGKGEGHCKWWCSQTLSSWNTYSVRRLLLRSMNFRASASVNSRKKPYPRAT